MQDMGEEEQELDLEEESERPRIADLIDHNYYFRQVSLNLYSLITLFHKKHGILRRTAKMFLVRLLLYNAIMCIN